MRRLPHENVATVLVHPAHLRALELALVERDLWVWPVATAPICVDSPRRASQLRQRMVEQRARRLRLRRRVGTSLGSSFGGSSQVGRDEPLALVRPSQTLSKIVSPEHADHVRHGAGSAASPGCRGPREVLGSAVGGAG